MDASFLREDGMGPNRIKPMIARPVTVAVISGF